MTIKEVLDSLSEDECQALMQRLEDDQEWNCFFHGFLAAFGYIRHRRAVAMWLSRASYEAQGAFIVDLTLAVAAVVDRHDHDPKQPPSEELVHEISNLTVGPDDVEATADDPRVN